MKKNLVLGILAHVDAGKTSLSEAILFVPAVANGIRIVRNTVYSDQENDVPLLNYKMFYLS